MNNKTAMIFMELVFDMPYLGQVICFDYDQDSVEVLLPALFNTIMPKDGWIVNLTFVHVGHTVWLLARRYDMFYMQLLHWQCISAKYLLIVLRPEILCENDLVSVSIINGQLDLLFKRLKGNEKFF